MTTNLDDARAHGGDGGDGGDDERRPDVVLLDLDGVVWLAGHPIPGAVGAVAELQGAGVAVGFVTNSSAPTIAEHEAALDAIGIDAPGAVLSSATAAASLLADGERVLVCGGPGLVTAARAAGAEVVVAGEPGGVVTGTYETALVGLDRQFTYAKLTELTHAILGGARFVATNPDRLFPTPGLPVPGAGSVIAAVATASGVQPVFAGKPAPAMADVARAHFGLDGRRVLMVGDQMSTDGHFAAVLGAEFALVRTGNTAPDEVVASGPGTGIDLDVADLAVLATRLLARRP